MCKPFHKLKKKNEEECSQKTHKKKEKQHVISSFFFCHGVLTLYHTILTFNDPEKMPFENIWGKGENAGNQHFLLFPQCFLPIQKRIFVLKLHLF